MSYQVELRHLHYFQVLAEELHFRKAAERLYISQPGLTRQIKQLEEIYGTLLFERGKRFVQLTPAGRYLKSETDILTGHLEHIRLQLHQIGEGKIAELRIGFIGSAAQIAIPDILYRLNKKYPGIEVNLNELPNETQVEYLLEDKLDCGVVRMRYAPAGLRLKKIYEEPFALVVPKDHPVQAKNFRSLKQFEKEQFILFGRDYSNDYYELVMSIFSDHDFTPRVHHKTVNALTIFKLVEKKMGIAVVPASLRRGYDVPVRFIELNRIPQRSQLSLLWNRNNRNPGMKPFLEIAGK
ncbi:LysR substrate-binding domain-containing protein [Niabella beijingensis]|uniref:LysR substrate-binding domain-containing protein n=1 Tax=Niabella beijingensis TaxID=2872700 RepID=UPI001CBD4293|nr:LysR substrate-binding domain-containing protein [Niabella beijingensis]MBZ4187753.1 LysR family transcriptional regulator [Niabella beijingensis]